MNWELKQVEKFIAYDLNWNMAICSISRKGKKRFELLLLKAIQRGQKMKLNKGVNKNVKPPKFDTVIDKI